MNSLTYSARVSASIILLSLLTSAAFGQASQVNARGDLVADDFYDWGSEYAVGDPLSLTNDPTQVTLTTDFGDTIDLEVPRGGPFVLVEAVAGNFGVDTWGGRFTAGDMVMNTAPFVTSADGTVENITSFTNFTAANGVCGFGTQIQPFAGTAYTGGGPYDYTARIEGFSGGGSVGSFPVNGISTNGVDGGATFVGIRNDSALDAVTVSVTVVTPLNAGVEIGDFAINHITLEFCDGEPEPEPGLYKTLLSGPDEDADLEPDLVIEASATDPATYSFELLYVGEDAVDIVDRVTNSWDAVEGATDELNCVFDSSNGKDDGKSPTDILCSASETGVLVVDTIARCTGKKDKCKPKDCGAIYLNEGAQAFDGDGFLVFESNSLCLAAVNGDLLAGTDRDADADHDGDGIPSHAEACTAEVKTDPCQADTDGDGDNDDVDVCPLDPLNECV